MLWQGITVRRAELPLLTPSECSLVASSSDMNNRVNRVKRAHDNCWFIEGMAECSEDTYAFQTITSEQMSYLLC